SRGGTLNAEAEDKGPPRRARRLCALSRVASSAPCQTSDCQRDFVSVGDEPGGCIGQVDQTGEGDQQAGEADDDVGEPRIAKGGGTGERAALEAPQELSLNGVYRAHQAIQ